MKISKIILSIFLVITLLFSVSASAVAQSVTPTSKRAERIQDRCGKVTTEIQTRITNAGNNLIKRQAWVSERKQKLQNRINKLKNEGADVTQLTTSFQTFSAMMDKWITDFQTAIADLKATQQFTCGDAHGKFVKALKTAREQFKIVEEDGDGIRLFWKKTLKHDFHNVYNQVREKKKTVSPTSIPGK